MLSAIHIVLFFKAKWIYRSF